MRTSKQIFFIVLLAAGLACNLPGTGLPDQNTLSTSAAQTVIAGLTQAVQPLSSPIAQTDVSPITIDTPTITLTPTETLTPTPIFTATSNVPLMSVSTPTNCRTGPGKVYDRVGAILEDETAEVLGRSPDGEYWYIRNPDNPNGFCWAWGEFATLTGPVQQLPVFTPPPTPTPSPTPTPIPTFTVEFTKIDECSGWWPEFKLKNTGTVAFKSIKMEVLDNATDVELTLLVDKFINENGCLKTTKKDILNPGDEFTVSGPIFSANPTNHNMRAFITLCTAHSQKGTCITEKLNFKP